MTDTTSTPSRPIRRGRRILTGLITLISLAVVLSGCSSAEMRDLTKQQEEKKESTKNSQERRNLTKKYKRDEDPNAVGYVYILSMTGEFIGYYVVKGKISSNGSQISPEDNVLCTAVNNYDSCQVTDGPQDDGTYGEGDPGIFFFTAEDVMVVTSLPYFYATQRVPNAIDVPKFG